MNRSKVDLIARYQRNSEGVQGRMTPTRQFSRAPACRPPARPSVPGCGTATGTGIYTCTGTGTGTSGATKGTRGRPQTERVQTRLRPQHPGCACILPATSAEHASTAQRLPAERR